MAEAEKKVTLKLLVDRKKHVVLFAEARKDFVDFLFHILTLPVGTVIRLLGKTGMVGSLGNLYSSIESLNDTYWMQPSSGNSDVKDSLLMPKTPADAGGRALSDIPLLLTRELTSSDHSQKKTYYRCRHFSFGGAFHDYVAASPSATCPICNLKMNGSVTLEEVPPHKQADADHGGGCGSRGYVKGLVTYIVMDDLLVKPMSTLSGITLLKKFNVTDLNCLHEKVVEFGMKEAVALLKASLQSKTALTDVFLAGKRRSDQCDRSISCIVRTAIKT